ncbi:MAG: flagellar biosynthesis regulator FlaF [Parvibaculum sp.]|uniref:flagellar biosynthesis regulator FlaF n=1 Tax=Parvibaculum sp. TaxID=2024848 RepID=UPI003C77BD80
MSRPHEAYAAVAKSAVDPREFEASVLLKAASQFQRIKDNWETAAKGELQPALLYNRRLWTVFATAVTEEDHPMPREIRQNIANLAIFILKHTIDVQANPAPERLDSFININRQIAAGLLQRSA